jgi:hypothetical protein
MSSFSLTFILVLKFALNFSLYIFVSIRVYLNTRSHAQVKIALLNYSNVYYTHKRTQKNVFMARMFSSA